MIIITITILLIVITVLAVFIGDNNKNILELNEMIERLENEK